jgi:hypothetical protein
MRKLTSILLFIILFLSVVPFVSAQAGGMEGIGEFFYNTFGFVGNFDLGKIGVEDTQTFWAKFIIFALVASVLGYVSHRMFEGSPRVAMTVAVLVAAISTLAIPGRIIAKIFATYSLVFIVFAYAIPLALLVFIKFSLDRGFNLGPRTSHVLGMIIAFFMLYIIREITDEVVASGGNAASLFGIVSSLLSAYILYSIIMIIVHSVRGGDAFAGASPLGRIGDWFRNAWRGRDDASGGDGEPDIPILPPQFEGGGGLRGGLGGGEIPPIPPQPGAPGGGPAEEDVVEEQREEAQVERTVLQAEQIARHEEQLANAEATLTADVARMEKAGELTATDERTVLYRAEKILKVVSQIESQLATWRRALYAHYQSGNAAAYQNDVRQVQALTQREHVLLEQLAQLLRRLYGDATQEGRASQEEIRRMLVVTQREAETGHNEAAIQRLLSSANQHVEHLFKKEKAAGQKKAARMTRKVVSGTARGVAEARKEQKEEKEAESMISHNVRLLRTQTAEVADLQRNVRAAHGLLQNLERMKAEDRRKALGSIGTFLNKIGAGLKQKALTAKQIRDLTGELGEITEKQRRGTIEEEHAIRRIKSVLGKEKAALQKSRKRARKRRKQTKARREKARGRRGRR